MTSKKNTRRALFSSIVSLILCCSMLMGTTYAWFTDSVESVSNVITAGNLDIEVTAIEGGIKTSVTEQTADGKGILFNEIENWEPGVVAYENVTVENAGTLALKYQMALNFETEGVARDGVSTLANALKIAVVPNGVDATEYPADSAGRAKLIADLVNHWQSLEAFYQSGKLLPQDDAGVNNYFDTYGLVIYWEPGNDDDNFNMNNDYKNTKLSITLGINVFATQLEAENDSFGDDYDAGAAWTGSVDVSWYTDNPDATEFTLNSAEDLAGLAAIVNGTATNNMVFALRETETFHDDFAGKTIKLGADIDLNGISWTPIGRIGVTSTDFTYSFKGIFDGQNYTVHDLEVSAYGWAGLFGVAHSAEIKNLTIHTVGIQANRMAGAVVGQLYGSIYNCHVVNADIMVTPNAVGDSYDNGDKVGGIVGWLGDNGNNRHLTSCSATNVNLGAYRDVGGIAGYVASSTTVSGNEVDNLNITVDQTTYYYGSKDPNAGVVYGRTGGAISEESNTIGENVNITSTFAQNGITYIQDGITNEQTLYLVPADYEGTTVTVAEGTTIIGGYAFADNSNIEKIVLSSTVTTLNDRAFRDTSASTVVLNEGLTNISYQAFRNASNVTTVVIPSTVTTISKEAFQNSGITSLTIPANVTTIEYGGLRDMKNLETVIIESNADIPVYAFRACTNLRTVVLTGEDVTFGGGSRGMIFTNKENGDGSAITVYVANEAVKERLLAADTAAKDYGGYAIVVGEIIDSAEDLSAALESGADMVYVIKGTYSTLPANKMQAGTTLVCEEGTVFEGTSSLNINGATVVGATFDAGEGNTSASGTINGTFKDCTFTGGSEGVRWTYVSAGETVVFENCKFLTNLRGFHSDGMDGNLKFINCEINGFNAYGGKGTVTFEGCTFGYDESRYNGLNIYSDTTLTNCTFNFVSGKTNFIDMEDTGKTLTVNNCKATLDGNAIDITTMIGGSKLNENSVFVDGDDIINTIKIGTLEELIAFANDVNVNGNGYSGKTVVLTADIDLNNMEWTPIGQTGGNGVATYFQGRFDGKGHTIKNLKITDNAFDEGANYAAGFFGFVDAGDARILNLTIDGATVNGHHWTGVIAGYLTGDITDCTVKNAVVNCTHANNDACGDKAGVIVGYVNSGSVTRNTVQDCTVTAGRDAGQVVGASKSDYVADNTVSNVTVNAGGNCTGANIRNEHIGRVL